LNYKQVLICSNLQDVFFFSSGVRKQASATAKVVVLAVLSQRRRHFELYSSKARCEKISCELRPKLTSARDERPKGEQNSSNYR
jgi:hypothetical protein